MTQVTYKVVQHDGGWAYTFDGVFSEAFTTHGAALAAARRAAAEQRPLLDAGAISVARLKEANERWLPDYMSAAE